MKFVKRNKKAWDACIDSGQIGRVIPHPNPGYISVVWPSSGPCCGQSYCNCRVRGYEPHELEEVKVSQAIAYGILYPKLFLELLQTPE